MLSHSSYATDTQAKSTDLATTVVSASSPPQIASACDAIESFLHKHTPDQTRWFFSITFPALICKIFGFDHSSSSSSSSPHRLSSPKGWIDVVTASNDSELAGKIFNLLSPNSLLLSSISAVDRLSLVKYVFPVERLPEWVRYMLQNQRDCGVLADLCPLFKGRVKEDSTRGSSIQVQLNVYDYYMFWFAYYPVCKGNSENCDRLRLRRGRRFRLENWASSIPGLSYSKRGAEQKMECNLYIRLLYAYLRAYVPVYDLNAHQPYRSSLLHYSSGYDSSVLEQAEFFVNAQIHYWFVDNDFSPLPVNVCKSFGVNFSFQSVLGESPPTSGLGEVVNVFVKYLNLCSTVLKEGHDQVQSIGSPRWKASGHVDVNSRDMNSGVVSSWNSWIQRPLYRYILRTFLFCPMEASIKNASQVFSVWISYIEPWMISLEDFKELDANVGMPTKDDVKNTTRTSSYGYSSLWQGFVLTNYLFYSSLVMHFFGFAHRFLHTDAEVIVQMVSKVINMLTSSKELIDLIKTVDTVFHSKPSGSSKLMPNNLYRFVPAIREQLQDWEDGLCESDADGSFLHENWNKDLRLFSDGEDGGQQLLQLFVLRAESELQAIGGDSYAKYLQNLDSLKAQLGCLFGAPILKSKPGVPEVRQCQQWRDEIFKPRVGGSTVVDVKYKGDWMKRPISNDEVVWLAKLLVNLSDWFNAILGLDQGENINGGPSWSYLEVPRDISDVSGSKDTVKVLWYSFTAYVTAIGGEMVKLMRKYDLRVNLRFLASKKFVTVLLFFVVFSVLKKAFRGSWH